MSSATRPWSRPLHAAGLLGAILLGPAATAQLTANFVAEPTSGPAVLTVQFTDTTTGGEPVGRLWSFGDGAISSEVSPTHTYLLPGTHDVSLTVLEDIFSTDTVTKRGLITVHRADLDSSFEATPTQGVVPLEVHFSDTTTGGQPVSWAWDFGDGGTSTEQDPVHVYTTPGTYPVSFSAQAPGQLPSEVTARDLITVEPAVLLHPSIEATPTQGVVPLAVQFTGMTVDLDPTLWAWDFGDGTTAHVAEPSHFYTAPGTYDVSLSVKYLGQDWETVTLEDLVTVEPLLLEPAFTHGPSLGHLPLEVHFQDETTGEVEPQAWFWDFGDGSTSNLKDPVHTYSSTGLHDVSLTVAYFGQLETVVVEEAVAVRPPLPSTFSVPVGTVDIRVPGFTVEGGRVAATEGRVAMGVHESGSAPFTDPFVVIVEPRPNGVWQMAATLAPPVPQDSAWFGGTLALDGTLLVVGDLGDDLVERNAGAAHVYRRQPDGRWAYLTRLVDPALLRPDEFFGAGLAMQGSRIVVGAPGDISYDGPGGVFVFEVQADDTVEPAAVLLPDVPLPNQGFGGAIAVDRDTILVGARFDDAVARNAGAVFIYDRGPGGAWSLTSRIDSPEGAEDEGFGAAVALEGDLAAITALGLLSFEPPEARVYLFRRQEDGTWVELDHVSQPPTQQLGLSPGFGRTIDLVRGRVFAGIHGDDTFGEDAGAVAMAKPVHGTDTWVQAGLIHATDFKPDRWFGWGLSATRNLLAVGERHKNPTLHLFAPLVTAQDLGGGDEGGPVLDLLGGFGSPARLWVTGLAPGSAVALVVEADAPESGRGPASTILTATADDRGHASLPLPRRGVPARVQAVVAGSEGTLRSNALRLHAVP